jgi:tRNA pseudouridine32 synthase/23S rRNA pseudouridine746 synthase
MTGHALEIVHEDERLIAVSKPSGVAVAAGGGVDAGATLLAQVERHVGAKAFLVHRLDRGTSGVIVLAKDADTHRRLSSLFESRQVEKTYVALVAGHVEAASGEIDHPLRAFGSGRVAVDRRGKPAITRYALTERLPSADLLEVHPLTGRRHQIRVHLYALGHAVIGDTRYGHDRPVGGAARLMLHARELVLPESDGTTIVLRAEPPEDFAEILEAHRTAAGR